MSWGSDGTHFCMVCKVYDRSDALALFSRRARGHPACLLKRHGVAILRRIVPAHLHRFHRGLLRLYPGATTALRQAKRMWEPPRRR